MKNFKSSLSILALLVGIVTSFAFRSNTTTKNFVYQLNNTDVIDSMNPDNYTIATPGTCPGDERICYIIAEEDPENLGHPIIDGTLAGLIEDALRDQEDKAGVVFLRAVQLSAN